MPTKTESFTLRLDADLRQWLDAYCTRDHRTAGQVVRLALIAFLTAHDTARAEPPRGRKKAS